MRKAPGLRTVLRLLAAVILAVGGVALAYHFVSPPSTLPDSWTTAAAAANSKPAPGLPWFVNVADASGIHFRHYDCITPMLYIQESLGSGLGWIDYNNDGWPDLFVVQDAPVQGTPPRARGLSD